jgi:general secretion pathway protein B
MSYILEALKKAEQKRSRGELPDLQSVTGAPSTAPPKSGGLVWKRLLVLALLGNILVFSIYGGFIRIEPSRPVIADPAGSVRDETRGGSGEGKGRADKAVPSTVKDQQPPSASARNPEKGEVRSEERNSGEEQELPRVAREKPPVIAPAAGQVNLYAKLPSAVQAGIPKMTMTLHFYVSDAAARMVRINGRNLREGDGLNEGVKIAEITPQGVVFESAGYRFEVPGLMVARR